jgi:hypothetical protein
MKVVNIGIIIRNDHNDTFPVALTPQMVNVIQNLLIQIPMLAKGASGLLDAQGKPVAAQPSIPIIPRIVDFNWEEGYKPMNADEEKELMTELMDKYKKLDEENAEAGEGDPDGKVNKLQIGEDPLNPFNLELESKGTANVGMSNEEVEEAMTEAEEKDSANDLEINDKDTNPKRQDCTVIIPAPLGLSSKAEQPGT